MVHFLHQLRGDSCSEKHRANAVITDPTRVIPLSLLLCWLPHTSIPLYINHVPLGQLENENGITGKVRFLIRFRMRTGADAGDGKRQGFRI